MSRWGAGKERVRDGRRGVGGRWSVGGSRARETGTGLANLRLGVSGRRTKHITCVAVAVINYSNTDYCHHCSRRARPRSKAASSSSVLTGAVHAESARASQLCDDATAAPCTRLTTRCSIDASRALLGERVRFVQRPPSCEENCEGAQAGRGYTHVAESHRRKRTRRRCNPRQPKRNTGKHNSNPRAGGSSQTERCNETKGEG
jgi:hypothetical protein